MNCNEDGAERQLVVCPTYLLYDSEDPPPPKELEELVHYCESENHRVELQCTSYGMGQHLL